MNKIRLGEALHLLEESKLPFQFRGDPHVEISQVAEISRISDECIGFLRRDGIDEIKTWLNKKNAVVLKIDQYARALLECSDANLIGCDLPELAIYVIGQALRERPVPSIHPLACISKSARLSNSVSVGALSVIGPNVVIGDNSIINEGCVISNAQIAEGTVIQSGVKIGSDALGAIKNISGDWCDRPHFGSVVIGKNVRIEDNTVINRGYLRNTVIEDNVRIGPLCAIGNGVVLQRGVLLAQSVTIAGSVSIGEDTAVWGNVSIREGVTIARGCVIGMGSVLLTDTEDQQLWIGAPATMRRSLRPLEIFGD
jgi:UDP-3-O-[3-hydroxymyristoyl] glucosamine N-acyltransferase